MAVRVRGIIGSRRAAVAALLACLGTLWIAGTAFACTIIMGQLTLSPVSGSSGSVVTTAASGLKAAPATYRLVFSNAHRVAAGKSCMSASKVLRSSVPTDASGAWSNVTVTIPATSPLGPSQICGMENSPVKNQTGTTHDTFTVT